MWGPESGLCKIAVEFLLIFLGAHAILKFLEVNFVVLMGQVGPLHCINCIQGFVLTILTESQDNPWPTLCCIGQKWLWANFDWWCVEKVKRACDSMGNYQKEM